MKTRNWSRLILLSAIILLIGFSLLSLQTVVSSQESDSLIRASRKSHLSANEDTVVWETIGSPETMDPHVNYESFGSWILYNVYETLYTYPWDSAETYPLLPLLAASDPVVSVDGLNYTITLRTGITFHDGTPFNASCVKWNIERAMKIFSLYGPVWMLAELLKGGWVVEDAAYSYGPTSLQFETAFDNWVANSNSIIVLNDNTIRFVLEQPYAGFIAAMTFEIGAMMSPSFAIVHASSPAWASWEDYGVDYGEDDGYMADHTCGTGPYMLTNWIVGQYIELDLYGDYWRTSTSTGAGSIEKVFIYTNEDQTERSFDLRTGKADGVYWPTTYASDIWNASTSTSLDPNINVSTGGVTYSLRALGYSIRDINTTAGMIITSPYANKDFRYCSSYAFDYDGFVSAAYNGFDIQAKGPIPYGMFGYNATSYKATYNLTAAVEYWNAAMTDPVFVQSMNDMSDTLEFYYNTGNTLREQISLFLADSLSQVIAHPAADLTGLDDTPTFTTQALDWPTYLEYMRFYHMPVYDTAWFPDYADPDNFVYPFCYQFGVWSLRIGYNNSEIDTYYQLARAETDPDTRMGYYNHINDLLAEDTPYLWLCQPTEFRTWRTWLYGDGLIYNPMHDVYFYHVYKTYNDATPPQIDHPEDMSYTQFTTGHSLTWNATDVNPWSYTIYLDDAPVKSGAWNSSSEVIAISVDGLGLGTHNCTILFTDIADNAASDEVMVTVVDGTAPTIDSPTDIQYAQFTTGHTVTWHPADANPQSYIIYLDDAPVKSGAWNSSSEVIAISVDGLGLGTYNYTLLVTDLGASSISDEVLVTVVDGTYPTINSPADIEYTQFTTGHTITWHPLDANPQSYVIYLESVPVKSGAWNSSSETITISVDGLSLGTYNYTLLVTDLGANSASDVVMVTVIDVTFPTIDSPPDIEYYENDIGNMITWHPYDVNPQSYFIYRNNSILKSGLWNSSSETIEISVDALELGVYNYTVLVLDMDDNSIRDEVLVIVVDGTHPTIDSPTDIQYAQFTTGHSITWHPADAHPHSYVISLDGTSVMLGAWNSSSEVITISVDGLSLGTHSYVISVTDIGANSVNDEVMVTVADITPPTIDSPEDIEYAQFTTGHSITWHPADANPKSYTISLDGTSVKLGAWNSSSEVITISVDGLSLGPHSYVISVTDLGENTVIDTVVVRVVETTTSPDLMVIIATVIGVSAVSVVIVVIIVRFIKGRR
ncbi:MAG: ABC transporter substrate-binding protein [Promethearchaeota archaeon]